MKKLFLLLSLVTLCAACGKERPFQDEYEVSGQVPEVADPIPVCSPKPQASLSHHLTLTEAQQAFVAGSNAFAFKCVSELYREAPSSMIFSPLSLQYALAMAANGASGKTAQEISRALGFDGDQDAVNAFCNMLLNELPALDPDVVISLADAVVVDSHYKLLPAYRNALESLYYAPVEYMSMADKKSAVDRINEWASRNTGGLIFPFLNEADLDGVVAVLLNALYFKAPWLNSLNFLPENTRKGDTFYKAGGGKGKVDMMVTSHYLGYVQRDGYRMLEIPYAGGRFAMYILLPDDTGGLKKLMARLPKESWQELRNSLTGGYRVNLRLPKFETASNIKLIPALKALGIQKAFASNAEFDRMLESKGQFYIGQVVQKAKIKVTEWGTEAAAATAVMVSGAALAKPKEVNFFADHPFAYVIAEGTSGTILFEGVFTGE